MYLSLVCYCRFYYAKGMKVDEAYVFVCYDSRADGRARFTPHTSNCLIQSSASFPADMHLLQMHSTVSHALWSGVRHQQKCRLEQR